MMQLPGALKEKDGKPSYSRIFGTIIISTFLILAVILTVLDGKIPDIPAGWALLAGGIYGVNKLAKGLTRGK